MGDYAECRCGGMIRLRYYHDRYEWVHVQSGKPHCLGPRAQPVGGQGVHDPGR
jgi:hypothetical protein